MYKISSQNTQNLNRTRKHPLLKGVAGPFSTGLGILIRGCSQTAFKSRVG